MALSMLITLVLNLLSTMALKFDLNSAKVVSRLMALWHSKPICLMALSDPRAVRKVPWLWHKKNLRPLL